MKTVKQLVEELKRCEEHFLISLNYDDMELLVGFIEPTTTLEDFQKVGPVMFVSKYRISLLY